MAGSIRMPSSFENNPLNEPGWQKLKRKLREEPLIFLGLGLTVAALVNAIRAVQRRDSWAAQKYFRARVGAQFFTVMAAVGGGIYYSDDRLRNREAWRAKAERDAEEKRVKWIRELEARDEEDKRRARLLKARRAAQAAKAALVDGPQSPVGPGSGDMGQAGTRAMAVAIAHMGTDTATAPAIASLPPDTARLTPAATDETVPAKNASLSFIIAAKRAELDGQGSNAGGGETSSSDEANERHT